MKCFLQPRVIEEELRAQLLKPVLAGTAILGVVGLLAHWVGLSQSLFYPWDSLWLLVVSAGCGLLWRRGKIASAASFYIAGISQPFFYASQFYGISSPVNVLFLLGIVLCGLLVGGWFLGIWTVAYCLWMVVAAWDELNGSSRTLNPIQDPMTMGRYVLFWCAAFELTGWLVWLFATKLESTVKLARGQATALTRTLQALSDAPEVDTFLRQVLQVIAEQVGAHEATLWLHDPASDTLEAHLVYTKGAVQRADAARAPLPASESLLWQELLTKRQPIHVTDVSNDPRLRYRADFLAQGVQSILYLPLVLGEHLIGSLSLHHQSRHRYRQEELELAQALIQQVILAMQLTRLGKQVQEAVVVQERNRMAREIHDTLAQGFTGIVVQLEAAEDVLKESPDAALTHLERARALARSSLAEARRSVWALRPLALEEASLPVALERLARQLAAGTPLQVEVEVRGTVRPIPIEMESNLLRIGQEALTNAIRHARPTRLHLMLSYEVDRVRLQVQDDGVGLASSTASQDGFGLHSMRERAEQGGGSIAIESARAGGTRVMVEMPLVGEFQP